MLRPHHLQYIYDVLVSRNIWLLRLTASSSIVESDNLTIQLSALALSDCHDIDKSLINGLEHDSG